MSYTPIYDGERDCLRLSLAPLANLGIGNLRSSLGGTPDADALHLRNNVWDRMPSFICSTRDSPLDSDNKEDYCVGSAGILRRLVGIQSVVGFLIIGQGSIPRR
jgi:hypothetical protein